MPHKIEIHNQYGNITELVVLHRGCYALRIINHIKYDISFTVHHFIQLQAKESKKKLSNNNLRRYT